jgi:hypothetical protein
MLIWVQDAEEIEKIYKKDKIRVNNRLCKPNSREYSLERVKVISNSSMGGWDSVLGKYYYDLPVFSK